MAYLSLASVIQEMNGAEADARRMLDLSIKEEPNKPEEKPPTLNPMNKPSGLIDSTKKLAADVAGLFKTGTTK